MEAEEVVVAAAVAAADMTVLIVGPLEGVSESPNTLGLKPTLQKPTWPVART